MFETNTEKDYIDMMTYIVDHAPLVATRTGVKCYTMPHTMLSYDMSDGTLPLMTHKKMGMKSISAQLWCFLHGVTSKSTFQQMKCNIWDEWCNPLRVPSDLKGQQKLDFMKSQDDLGKIYGYQWRNFDQNEVEFQQRGDEDCPDPMPTYMKTGGFDQITQIEKQLKTEEGRMSRRLLCSAWNPNHLTEMALPPCHYSWQVRVIGDTLHLNWTQRSVDTFLGLPFNIASYGLLLALLADTNGLKRGKLTGFLSDVHVYENHVNQVRQAAKRTLYKFPNISFAKKYNSILEWNTQDNVLTDYKSGDRIHAPVAV